MKYILLRGAAMRKFALSVVAAVLSFALVGCGSDDKTITNKVTTPATSPATSPAAK